MSATFNEMIQKVEEIEHVYYLHPKMERMILPSSAAGELVCLYLERQEEGKVILFTIPCFLTAPKPTTEFLQRLLELNAIYKIGQFSYDPSDGEVVLDYELILQDAGFTGNQLQQVINALLGICSDHRNELRNMLPIQEDDLSLGFDVDEMIKTLMESLESEPALPSPSDSQPIEKGDPVRFVQECCEFEPTSSIECQQLYSSYRNWCRQNALTCLPKRQFTKMLKSIDGITREFNGNHKSFWIGIKRSVQN